MDQAMIETPGKLSQLAEIAVRIGVNVQRDQELIINAPVEAVPLVRALARHAYRAGARDVLVNYTDQNLARIQLTEGADPIFDHAPTWRYNGITRALQDGAAILTIAGSDPNLLAGCDATRQARSQKAHALAAREMRGMIGGFRVNWSIISFAHPAWAQAVFPHLPASDAVEQLWSAIFAASRIGEEDAVANWAAHVDQLHARAKKLNESRFAALRLRGPGTDLRVGLIDGHVWAGGAVTTPSGIRCLPNIPTEEVFTMPHRERVEGTVRATKPLSYQGTLIEGIEVRFEAGRIVHATARTGEDIFRNLIAVDEGAARLGEIALVPDASPISRAGLLFQNTLFDENAASHIAIGRALGVNAPAGSLEGVDGANDSLIHVDWMIGSGEIDVDGEHADGTVMPVMRLGAFV